MRTCLAVRTGAGIQLQIQLRQTLEMPERNLQQEIQNIEASEDFGLLKESGALRINPYSDARWAARRFAGRELRVSDSNLPEFLDGQESLAEIIRRMGQERFEECFLKGDFLSDEERAKICGAPLDEVRKIRGFLDDFYIRSEFASASPPPEAPRKSYSVVAGIQLENKKPVLAFFSREIWKGRYQIDALKKEELLARLPPKRARDVSGLAAKLLLIERRKSTLYQVLEILIEFQADYLASGDLEKRRPLTQRAVAQKIGVSTSSLQALVSNKALELPWGLEAPLKSLMPTSKAVSLGQINALAAEFPGLSDAELSRALVNLLGLKLSRRSVAQYRSELGI